ncbi:MAG: helix-turn-helix domain-containing protein [Chitinophagales bacterium]
MNATKTATAASGHKTCGAQMIAVKDALEILQGKWKLPIILSVSFGTRRFREIAREIPGITDKMLSKELRELEMNLLVKRSVFDTFPPTVEYEITEHGKSLQPVIMELGKWGQLHRKKILSKR